MSIKVNSITKDTATGARIVKVRTSSSKSFRTPSRSITSTEHGYRAQTIDRVASSSGLGQGTSTTFKNHVCQITKSHDLIQLRRFLRKNGAFKVAKSSVVGMRSYYPDKLLIYYPAFTKKMLYVQNEKLGIDNLKTLVDFQVHGCGLKNISIPESHPNQGFDIFKKDYENLGKRALAYGGELIVPYLDLMMASDLFKLKYQYLIDSEVPIIGVSYRGFDDSYPNLRYLQERDDDVLIICSGVDRYWPGNYTTSLLHIPNFYGADITSLESRPAPPPTDENGNPILKKKELHDIKRFDSKSLGIIKLGEHEKKYGDKLNCKCAVCNGKNLTSFIEEYSKNSIGKLNTDLLDKFCKLHEVYSSRKEFINERKYIVQDDTKNYVNSRRYLKTFFEQNKKYKQNTLH